MSRQDSQWGSTPLGAPRVAAALLVAALGSGCVTVYQPLVALQRPVVVDTRLGNFEGVRVLLRCLPGDYLDSGGSMRLCQRVGALFRNQGAQVETEVPRNGRAARESGEGPAPELIIDLASRLLHQEDSMLLKVLSGFTFTLVPSIAEYTVAQDITIRDASGFVLATDTLQARFVRYAGAGVWGANWVLDALVRPDEDELTGDVPNRDFSRDFYGQLSQLAFNAHVRSVVLKGFEAPQAGGAP